MAHEPLRPGARRQLYWIAGGTVVAVLIAAPFLFSRGAFGWFLLACTTLGRIILCGQREDALRQG